MMNTHFIKSSSLIKCAIITLLSIATSLQAIGEYAWGSAEVSNKLTSSKDMGAIDDLEEAVQLDGFFTIEDKKCVDWMPSDIVITEDGEVKFITPEDPIVVTTASAMLMYGTYDPTAAWDAWIADVNTAIDEARSIARSKGKAFNSTAIINQATQLFRRAQAANYTKANSVVTSIGNNYQRIINSTPSGTVTEPPEISEEAEAEVSEKLEDITVTFDEESNEEITKLAEKMDEDQSALEDAREQLEESYEQGAVDAARTLTEAQADLSWAKEDIKEALENKDIDSLESALARYNTMIEKLKEAEKSLSQCEGPEAEQAKSSIQGLLTTANAGILNLISALVDAKTGDWKSAGTKANKVVEDTHKGMSDLLDDSEEQLDAIEEQKQEVIEKTEEKEMHEEAAKERQSINLTLIEAGNSLKKRISALTDIHRIGAYLGSKDSREFFTKRSFNNALTQAEWKRWGQFRPPTPIGVDYETGYTTFPIITDGTYVPLWDTIQRWLGSSFFVTYCDLETQERIDKRYEYALFQKDNIRGFYEEEDSVQGRNIKQWYASKIKAPKNWADGSTIFVRDGKFTSVPGRYSLVDNGDDGWSLANTYYRIGGTTYSGGDYNVPKNTEGILYIRIDISSSEPSATLGITESVGTLSALEGDRTSYIIPLYSFSGGYVTCDWRTGPDASMWEY